MKTPVGLVLLLLLGLVAGASAAPVAKACNDGAGNALNCDDKDKNVCCKFTPPGKPTGNQGTCEDANACVKLKDGDYCNLAKQVGDKCDTQANFGKSPGKCTTGPNTEMVCNGLAKCCVLAAGIGTCSTEAACKASGPGNKCTFPEKNGNSCNAPNGIYCKKNGDANAKPNYCNDGETCCNTVSGKCLKTDAAECTTPNGKTCLIQSGKSTCDEPTKVNTASTAKVNTASTAKVNTASTAKTDTVNAQCKKGNKTEDCAPEHKCCNLDDGKCADAKACKELKDDKKCTFDKHETKKPCGEKDKTPPAVTQKGTDKNKKDGAATAVATGPLLAGLLLLPILIPNNN